MTWPFSDDQASRRTPNGTAEDARDQAESSFAEPSHVSRAFEQATQFGQYRVLRLIAKGGMSEVYEALHVGLKKRVALKVLSPQLAHNPEFRQRFVAEAEYAARVHHPNVVDVTDIGVVDGLPYLVMTLLHGETLRDLYARRGRVPFRELVDLLLPIAAAVAAGHAHGVVHRDLKPENIFLHHEARRTEPKLLDFGVSIALDAASQPAGARSYGTPRYMSPEQERGDLALDARTDQFALSVILYEGLTGQLPRDDADADDEPRSVAPVPSQPNSEYSGPPRDLEAVIARAMAADPSERFASMREFAIALIPFASDRARDHWSTELASRPVEIAVSTPAAPTSAAAHRATSSGGRMEHTVLVEPPKRRAERPWGRVAVAALIAAAIPWLLTRIDRGGDPQSTATPAAATFELDVATAPTTAVLSLDGRQVGVGHYAERLPKDGRPHELHVTADGYASERVLFRDRPPPSQIRLRALPRPAAEPAQASRSDPEPNTPASTPPNRNLSGWLERRAKAPAPAVGVSATPVQTLAQPARAPAAPRAPVPPKAEQSVSATQVVGAALGTRRPKVRVIDERAPQVQVIE